MIHVYWPDGSVTRGETATEVLAKISDKQWDEPDDVKALLAQRAAGWNLAIIDPTLPDDLFLQALGGTGMVFVTNGQPLV